MKKNYRARNYRIIGIALGLLILSVGIPLTYKYVQTRQTGIYDFDAKREMPFILDMFTKNWYWFIPESTPYFDVESTFKYRSPTSNAQGAGTVSVKVYRDHGQPRAFIAYYLKKFYEGFIWFVGVDEKYRGLGYAQKLLAYALDDLKRQGATYVWLLTRANNHPAQHIYLKAGFEETSRDEKFVYFRKNF